MGALLPLGWRPAPPPKRSTSGPARLIPRMAQRQARAVGRTTPVRIRPRIPDRRRRLRGVPGQARVAIELGGHLARLHRSLASMAIEMPFTDASLERGISELLAANGWDGMEPAGDAAIRLVVSRGYDVKRSVVPHAGARPPS